MLENLELTDEKAADAVSKKDPIVEQDNINEANPRFKEVYAKMKDFERELEGMKADKVHGDQLVEAMKEHNAKLAESIEKGVTKAVESVNSRNELSDIDSKIEANTKHISELKEKRKQARKDSDFDAEDNISEEIDRLKDESSALRFNKIEKGNKKEEEAKPVIKSSTEGAWDSTSKRAVDEFIKQCPWYSTDSVLKAAAIQLDFDLVNMPEWQGKPLALRLAKVKEVMEERFHIKPSGNGSPYGSGSFGSGGGSGEEIKLSDLQKMAAAGLGLSESQYIEQLKQIGGK